jgi:hypothetical protein
VEIMVSLDEMDVDPAVDQFPEMVEHLEPVFGNHVVPLKPEVKKITQDKKRLCLRFDEIQETVKSFQFFLFPVIAGKGKMNI